MNILVINAGSSSIKYQLFDMSHHQVIASGLLERIGEVDSRLTHHWHDAHQHEQQSQTTHLVSNHHQGLVEIFQALANSGSLNSADELAAVGHRVVHGGEHFSQPVIINEQVVETIEQMIPLAPLHNPANLEGITVARKLCGAVPQVAVFDTAFHHAMPDHAYRYALPKELYENKQVRRYGFHGTSHHHVAKQAARFLEQDIDALNLITLHLGNGCSAAAIAAGVSIDTSMGMTPLEGLMMGTRSGDLDPAIAFYLTREADIPSEELESLLNKRSGLKGICGVSDMREVQQRSAAGDKDAALARRMFAYRIKKYIGAYHAILGRLDAIVFTGGIGENDAQLREAICGGLEIMGIHLNPEANRANGSDDRGFHAVDSRVKLLVIPTNEELEIAQQTLALIQ